MADKPKRIQRKRVKGWRMPENAVYVGRPTKWGNPFTKDNNPFDNKDLVSDDWREQIVFAYAWMWDLAPEEEVEALKDELRGKDLACWCRLDQDCHADVLLELANK